MKKLLLKIIVVLLISTTMSFAQGTDCSNATQITINSSFFGIADEFSAGQFFYFVPAQNGNVTLTINAMNPMSCNVKVDISDFASTQTGLCVAANTTNQIAANPDGNCPGLSNSTTFAVIANQVYYLRVFTDLPGGIENYELVVSANVPLPVELITQTVEKVDNKALLEWTTASELNNSHFEVSRSSDGENFETIGEISGNGTTTENTTYQFYDENPLSQNYYKITQYDTDGTATNFDIMTLTMKSQKEKAVNIYASNNQIVLDYDIEENHDYQIKLVNSAGQVVYNKTISLLQGENQLFINPTMNLPTGLYFVVLQNEQKTITEKVLFSN